MMNTDQDHLMTRTEDCSPKHLVTSIAFDTFRKEVNQKLEVIKKDLYEEMISLKHKIAYLEQQMVKQVKQQEPELPNNLFSDTVKVNFSGIKNMTEGESSAFAA